MDIYLIKINSSIEATVHLSLFTKTAKSKTMTSKLPDVSHNKENKYDRFV